MPALTYLQSNPVFTLSLLAGFSLLLGSFFNVVIYRLPKMMEARWKQECRLILEQDNGSSTDDQTFNLAFPNSHCPSCGGPVKAWQNIPLISYVLLRGRCASCQTPISPRYPAVELATAALAVFAALQFGFGWQSLAVIVFSWALLIMTMIDIDHQLLPDSLTLPLLWLGLGYNALSGTVPLNDAVWGAIFGYLSLWSVYWLFKLLTGKEGMGFGDFKLLAALGAWLGWQMLPVIILLSSVVGAVFGGLVLLLQGRNGTAAIPFGPYLAAAGLIALYWGERLLNSYLGMAGLPLLSQ
ncbi:A24 family peptidase [Spongiibacter sp.]|uniref:prepilin peptidase n=1 Tax=Spongiibacter sp. TaxID=2024860 RepID=UPI003569045A